MTDQFGIPTKVNRHVLRAVDYLTTIEGYIFAPLEEVQASVKYTMRNLNPVSDLENVIRYSLDNLSVLQYLVKSEQGYALNLPRE